MSFLYPVFLIGGLAVALPIVLHLMRRNVAPEVPFSAVHLLRRTPLEQTRRRRLRELVLLAARVLALLLLAGAFARPYLRGDANPRLHVVAIDRSYSMDAPGRFDRAIELARAAIDGSERGERVALVAFDDRATLVSGPGGRAEAAAALRGLRPGFGGTQYAAAVQRAIDLGEDEQVRLTIVTDMQRGGWNGQPPIAVPDRVRVNVVDAATASSPNLAVVSIRREPNAVVATVRNDGPRAAGGVARVAVEGRTVAQAQFAVPAGATADAPIPYRAADRAELAVEIDDKGGLHADNVRYAIADPSAGTRVFVVGDAGQSGFYLTRALEAAGGDDGFEVRAVSGAALSRTDSSEWTGLGAVLLLSTRSVDRRGRELLTGFVRAGGGLLVAAAPEVEPSAVAGIIGLSDFAATEQASTSVVLAPTDLRHPIFKPFGALAANLGQVRFTRTWRVRDRGWDVVARFSDASPALLERREGEGRVILFASDLDRRWNDFPLNPAFVPFVVEATRHVAVMPDVRREYPVAQVPAGVKAEPGFYTIPSGQRRIAVNVDVRESDGTRMNAGEFQAMLQPVAGNTPSSAVRLAQQAEGQQSLWRYGLMLMMGALVVESIVGRR